MCQTKTHPKVLIFRTTQKKIQRSTPSELGERAFLGSETGWGKSTFPTRLYEDAPSSFKDNSDVFFVDFPINRDDDFLFCFGSFSLSIIFH